MNELTESALLSPAAPLKLVIVDMPLLMTELLVIVVLNFQVAVGAGLMAGGAAIIGLQPVAAAVDTAAVAIGGNGDVTAETGAGVGLSCIMEEDDDILGAGAGLAVADN